MTIEKNQDLISPPKAFEAILCENFVNPSELHRIIAESELMRQQGTIIEIANADSALQTRDSDAAFYKLKILLGESEYRIQQAYTNSHDYGVGGESVSATALEKDGETVLQSVKISRYTTYSDDSEDHATGESAATYFVQDDILARAVFEAMRQS